MRSTLTEISKRLGQKYLAQVACVSKPATILAWCWWLVAQKFDDSKRRSYPGRPRISANIQALIVQMARENSAWGCDRIAGALANVRHAVAEGGVHRRERLGGLLNYYYRKAGWGSLPP